MSQGLGGLRTSFILGIFVPLLVLVFVAATQDVCHDGNYSSPHRFAPIRLLLADEKDDWDVEGEEVFWATQQLRQTVPETDFSAEINGKQAIQVVLVNGTADDEVTFSFRPENGKTIEDYDLQPIPSNPNVLSAEDVGVTYVADTSTGTLFYNITSSFDFNGWAGTTSYALGVVNRDTGELFASSPPILLTAVGLTFYYTDSSGKQALAGGDSHILQINYTDLLADGLFTLSVFIQYPDGKNSSEELNPAFPISGIQQTTQNLNGELFHEDSCAVDSGTYDGAAVRFPEGCSLGFSANNVAQEYVGPQYGFSFEKYRGGSFQVNFVWEDFTTGTEFDGQLYEFLLKIEIVGDIPVVVSAISPDGPFARPGGDIVTVVTSNAATDLESAIGLTYVLEIEGVGNASVVPGTITFDDITKNETLVLMLPEGNGTNLPWTFYVTYPNGNAAVALDITDPSYLFDYDGRELRIDSISPTSGDTDGNTTVVLDGSFPSFDPSKTSGIVMGGREVNSSLIQSYSETKIVFSTPPRDDIGSSSVYAVIVVIGSEVSNGIEFEYRETGFIVVIEGTGGSTNEDTGEYEIGVCGETAFRARLPGSALNQVISFGWTLTDAESGSSINILADRPEIVTDAETILLPFDVFPAKNRRYTLAVRVVTRYETLESSTTLVQLEVQRIGVQIFDPLPRSLSDPDSPLTIPADIGLPACLDTEAIVNSAAITYHWEFRSQSYFFSYLNETAREDEVSPTLLGREINIPQALLEYGTFTLRLTAFFTQREDISGSDTTTVRIVPADLIAQINGGESELLISEAVPVKITGEKSRDPDVLSGDAFTGLDYFWSCRYGWNVAFTSFFNCTVGLLPSDSDSSFTITTEALAEVRNTTKVYIEYSLTVSKVSQNASGADISRVSPTTISVLILSELPEIRYESLVRIDVLNNLSKEVDRSSLKYYEEVIITPVSSTEETVWRFELLEPRAESRTLLSNSENLLPYSGFYSELNEPARDSLGLRGGALKANTVYLFNIRYFRPGYEDNSVTLSLRTVEEPRVILGDLPRTTGNTDAIFAASAGTSYDGDFKFYFIIRDSRGVEFCLDGCQGVSIVNFRLGTAGEYTLRCDVYDSLGFTLLASATFDKTISVTSSTSSISSLAIFEEDLLESYEAGDHANYQQLGGDMVKHILESGGSNDQDGDSALLKNYTAVLDQVSANAVPNSVQSANFVRTAAALAQLTPDLGITYDAETLYSLINITRNAVSRTPDTAALRQIQDLLDFYNNIPELGLSLFVEGTSRRRLLQSSQDRDNHVRTIWLDLYETMKEQLSIASLKTTSCGAIDEYSTGVSPEVQRGLVERNAVVRQGSEASETLSSEDKLRAVNIKVGHICNPEQGLALTIEKGDETSQFVWCKEVFEGQIKELYFILITTPDYIRLSGIQEGRSVLTQGLTSVLVARIRNNNTLEDATTRLDGCYKVRMSIPKDALNVSNVDGDPKDFIPSGVRFAPSKVFDQSEVSVGELYQPDFSGFATEFQVKDDSRRAIVIVTTDMTGLMAVATRAGWVTALFGLEGIKIGAVMVAGVLILILLFVLVSMLSSWLVTTRRFQVAAAPPSVEEDFTFVERDIYGRNVPGLYEEGEVGALGVPQGAGSYEDESEGSAFSEQSLPSEQPPPPEQSLPSAPADEE